MLSYLMPMRVNMYANLVFSVNLLTQGNFLEKSKICTSFYICRVMKFSDLKFKRLNDDIDNIYNLQIFFFLLYITNVELWIVFDQNFRDWFHLNRIVMMEWARLKLYYCQTLRKMANTERSRIYYLHISNQRGKLLNC